jgi:hypothetical protein
VTIPEYEEVDQDGKEYTIYHLEWMGSDQVAVWLLTCHAAHRVKKSSMSV